MSPTSAVTPFWDSPRAWAPPELHAGLQENSTSRARASPSWTRQHLRSPEIQETGSLPGAEPIRGATEGRQSSTGSYLVWGVDCYETSLSSARQVFWNLQCLLGDFCICDDVCNASSDKNLPLDHQPGLEALSYPATSRQNPDTPQKEAAWVLAAPHRALTEGGA